MPGDTGQPSASLSDRLLSSWSQVSIPARRAGQRLDQLNGTVPGSKTGSQRPRLSAADTAKTRSTSVPTGTDTSAQSPSATVPTAAAQGHWPDEAGDPGQVQGDALRACCRTEGAQLVHREACLAEGWPGRSIYVRKEAVRRSAWTTDGPDRERQLRGMSAGGHEGRSGRLDSRLASQSLATHG